MVGVVGGVRLRRRLWRMPGVVAVAGSLWRRASGGGAGGRVVGVRAQVVPAARRLVGGRVRVRLWGVEVALLRVRRLLLGVRSVLPLLRRSLRGAAGEEGGEVVALGEGPCRGNGAGQRGGGAGQVLLLLVLLILMMVLLLLAVDGIRA